MAVQRLLAELGPDAAVAVEQDAYYRDQPGVPLEIRAGRNYDHPDSIESELLAEHLRRLREGSAVEVPCYDFARHQRSAETRRVEPRPCVLVEGILVLASEHVREALDLRLFIETEADIRLARRVRRDVAERGRTPESVLEQWEATVRPMHREFVEPSRAHADLIIPEAGLSGPALEAVVAYIRQNIGR
jgi:uridine kinase